MISVKLTPNSGPDQTYCDNCNARPKQLIEIATDDDFAPSVILICRRCATKISKKLAVRQEPSTQEKPS